MKAEGEGGGRKKVEGGEREEGIKRKRKTRKAGGKGSKVWVSVNYCL